MKTNVKKNCVNCENLEIDDLGRAECFYHKDDKCSPRSLQMHKTKKITNLEWVRSLPDEEFVKFISNFFINHCYDCVEDIVAWFNELREEG